MNEVREILDREPPHDTETEMAVLGCILLEPSVRESVSFLEPTDFYSQANSILFGRLMQMDAVDSVLLIDELRTAGELRRMGGTAYLAEVIHAVPVAAHVVHYARIVKEMARKRALVRLNLDVLRVLYSGQWTAEQLATRQMKRLRQILAREGSRNE